MRSKKEPKSKGTVIGEKIRAKANRLSDEERRWHLAKAMTLIYGGGGEAGAPRS